MGYMHGARNACCIAVLNLVHLTSGCEYLPFSSLLLHRIVPVCGGSSRKERELDLATCTE